MIALTVEYQWTLNIQIIQPEHNNSEFYIVTLKLKILLLHENFWNSKSDTISEAFAHVSHAAVHSDKDA